MMTDHEGEAASMGKTRQFFRSSSARSQKGLTMRTVLGELQDSFLRQRPAGTFSARIRTTDQEFMPAPCEAFACTLRRARNAEMLSITLKQGRHISRASVELGDFCFDRNLFLK
jgi:hypothetical protein